MLFAVVALNFLPSDVQCVSLIGHQFETISHLVLELHPSYLPLRDRLLCFYPILYSQTPFDKNQGSVAALIFLPNIIP